MRVAAIYDIHGNLPALEAVLHDICNVEVDLVVIGGDVVTGPMPVDTLSYLRDLDIPKQFIRGNTDREVLALMAGEQTDWYRTAPEPWREPIHWTAGRLSSEHGQWLAHWPPIWGTGIPGLGKVLFCHATPRNDTDKAQYKHAAQASESVDGDPDRLVRGF